MALLAPPPLIIAEILGPATQVTRRVDLYESDGTTIYARDVPLVDGSVSVSNSRAERRTMDLTFNNVDGNLRHFPGELWYDKIVKVYRGAVYQTLEWEVQIGQFMIDDIETPYFPQNVHITGRDYTKKLLTSKFPQATTFDSQEAPEDVIKTIALNAGITNFILPTTGLQLGTDTTFEKNTDRATAITSISGAFGYEVFFDATGYMVMRLFQDPLTSPEVWTFNTGEFGNLANFTKKSSDTLIINHWGIYGGSSDTLPLFVEVRNDNVASPTNIELIGDRYDEYSNPLFTDLATMTTVGLQKLKISALEQFELSFESIVFAWLDVNDVIEFVDPNPDPGDPTRYLMTDITIPMKLGTMPATAKRITLVG